MPRSLSKPHSASHRLERVGELIRHAVAEILPAAICATRRLIAIR